MSEPFTATNRVLHEWGIGGISYYWMAAVIYSFLSYVFISSYEMDPGWVALAMTLPRFIDIVIDPLLGRLSDNLHTRWGRRRPFIFVSSIIGAAMVVGVWWMPLDWVDKPLWSFTVLQPDLDWARLSLAWQWAPHVMPWSFPYLLIFTTLLFAALGVFEMSHTALSYELSDDYSLRSKVQAVRNLYFCLGALGGGFTYWIAQRAWFGHGHQGEVNGFRYLSIIMAAMVLVFGLIPVFCCRERFQNINRTHVRLWPALKATLKNRPFAYVLALRIIGMLGGTLYASLMFYIGVYSVFGGDKEWYALLISGGYGIAGVVLGWALIPLAAPITRWLGKRRGLIIGYGFAVLGAVLTPFFTLPGRPYLWFWFGFAFFPASFVLNNLLASVMPDICDLDELAHGERREGLFTAVMSFITKLEASICTGLAGWLLVLSGYDQHLIQQPQAVLDKMRLYAFAPLIAGAIVTFIVVCFFPLKKELMDSVRSQLDARHAALKVDVETTAKSE